MSICALSVPLATHVISVISCNSIHRPAFASVNKQKNDGNRKWAGQRCRVGGGEKARGGEWRERR
jgi:hypothetical protein